MTQSILLEGVTLEQLRTLIRKEITEGIKDVQQKTDNNNPTQKEGKYLTRYELANRLSISLPTLLKYTKEGIIQSYRIGTRVLYKEVDIDKALEVVSNLKHKQR